MNSIELQSSAKINLSIDIVGKYADGYHEVEMILQEIDLYDNINIEKRNENIEVDCSVPFLPSDERNLAYKAASVFFSYTGIRGGAGITLDKRIPVSAGLGGGSSNAACVLAGLNILYEAGLTHREMESLSCDIGSDVTFFIKGGTALCKRRGDMVEPIETEIILDLLIIKPDIAVSTKEIYGAFDFNNIAVRPQTMNLIDALRANDSITVSRNLVNVLENVTLKIFPEIRELKNRLLELGALNALMSGSGSSVFGIFKSRYDAMRAYDRITEGRYQKFVTRTRVK